MNSLTGGSSLKSILHQCVFFFFFIMSPSFFSITLFTACDAGWNTAIYNSSMLTFLTFSTYLVVLSASIYSLFCCFLHIFLLMWLYLLYRTFKLSWISPWSALNVQYLCLKPWWKIIVREVKVLSCTSITKPLILMQTFEFCKHRVIDAGFVAPKWKELNTVVLHPWGAKCCILRELR